MNATENRLVDSDRDRIRARVNSTVAEWRRQSITGAWTAGPADLDVLRRVACHSIGCIEDDLRESELAEIAATVAELAGGAR